MMKDFDRIPRGSDGAKRDPSPLMLYGAYGAAGIQLAATTLAGLFLGNALDSRWNTSPWLALAGLALGFVGGIVNLFKIVGWMGKERKESR